MDEAVAGHADLHRGLARRGRLLERRPTTAAACRSTRTRNSRQVRARNHHDHAARRRQIRLERLRDLRRPARRRRLRGQRALGALEVEVARGQTLHRQTFERGMPVTKLEIAGKAPNKRGTQVRFRPDPQIFGAGLQVRSGAGLQDDARQGLSVRRRRNPLALRAVAARRRRQNPAPRRFSTSPAASKITLPPTSRARRRSSNSRSPAGWRRTASTARSSGR